MNSNHLNNLFQNQSNWDIESPDDGHEIRFLQKLEAQKKRKFQWKPLVVAASLVLIASITFFNLSKTNENPVVLSPQTQETQDYFSVLIATEVKALKKQETPENKAIIEDALAELEKLELDYKNLKNDIKKTGENKQILFAMVVNMQTRLQFIQTILEQIDLINNVKNISNEANM
jgi:hypothetical protein